MRSVISHQVCCRRHRFPCISRPVKHLQHGWRPRIPFFVRIRTFSSINNRLSSDPSIFSPNVDLGLVRPDESQDALLNRAKAHGIDTLEQLSIEADLGFIRGTIQHRRQSDSRRLLDDDSIRQDLDLWSIVLDYRRAKDGIHGIRDILDAMLHGGKPVTLYDDAVSEQIWHTVLSVIIQDDKLLLEVCLARDSLIANRPTAFADIVGQLLATGNLRLAIIFGTQHLLRYFRGRSDLIHLFSIAFKLGTMVALENFCQLISRLPRHYIYGETVPELWNAGRVLHAFLLHRHLMSLEDCPRDFSQIEPFIRELAARKMSLEPFLNDLKRHDVSYCHQARHLYKHEVSRTMQASKKSTGTRIDLKPGARPVKLSDAFVARSFATRSVSFEFVLSGLRFVGLFEIGPLAVRELALAAGDVRTLKKRFSQLDETEVDLGSSNYVRVLKNLCDADQDKLLQAMLKSDMHHDVFEDVQTQKRLLNGYYRKSDWSEVDRTLAILSSGKSTPETRSRSLRQFLQTSLISGDWRGILNTLDNMRRMSREQISASNLAPLRLALKRTWAACTTKEETDYLSRYTYLVGFMQLAQSAKLKVRPWQWRAVIHAVGRSGDWVLFQSLILSIARMTYKSSQVTRGESSGRESEPKPLLDNLFDAKTQWFIIEIALTAAAKEQNHMDLWLRGMRLLRSLGSNFALTIDYESIRSVYDARIRELLAGAQVGMRRRFIGHYLACLNWAWVETSSPQEQFSHSMYQRGITIPDPISLKLFQIRSKFIRTRRQPVGPGLLKVLDQDLAFVELPHTDTGQSEDIGTHEYTTAGDVDDMEGDAEELDDSVVFYADLLHPSYKESKSV